jgi:surfactin synthase thioesterase subunit
VALTVEIARLLQEAGRKVEAVYLGGALPPARRRLWSFDVPIVNLMDRVISDARIHAYLKSLGGFDGLLDQEELAFVLRSFRHDVKQTIGYFERIYKDKTAKKTDAPIVCIVGDQDPFTKNYLRRHRDWGFFGHSVELVEIEGGGHYFVQHQAAEVAGIIAERDH